MVFEYLVKWNKRDDVDKILEILREGRKIMLGKIKEQKNFYDTYVWNFAIICRVEPSPNHTIFSPSSHLLIFGGDQEQF